MKEGNNMHTYHVEYKQHVTCNVHVINKQSIAQHNVAEGKAERKCPDFPGKRN